MGTMVSFKRPIEPYVIAIDEREKAAYQRLRVGSEALAA